MEKSSPGTDTASKIRIPFAVSQLLPADRSDWFGNNALRHIRLRLACNPWSTVRLPLPTIQGRYTMVVEMGSGGSVSVGQLVAVAGSDCVVSNVADGVVYAERLPSVEEFPVAVREGDAFPVNFTMLLADYGELVAPPANRYPSPITSVEVRARARTIDVTWWHPQQDRCIYLVERAVDESDWHEVAQVSGRLAVVDEDKPLGWVQYRVRAAWIPPEISPEDGHDPDYEPSGTGIEPIWIDQSAVEILEDRVEDCFHTMFPLLNVFSRDELVARNNSIRRMAEFMWRNDLLLDTMRSAAARAPHWAAYPGTP